MGASAGTRLPAASPLLKEPSSRPDGPVRQEMLSRGSYTHEKEKDRLPRKLEPDPAHPRYILTKVGIGYQLAAQSEVQAGRRFEMRSASSAPSHPYATFL